tara:strand:+ start:4832 stop:5314 length:483 start_codon:yes stop_codon:yes gene_type:complete
MREDYKRLLDNHEENLAMAYKICNNNTDKYDLVQEMYLKILLHIQKGKMENINIKSGYVFRTMRNAFVDGKKKLKKIHYVEDIIEPGNDEYEDDILEMRKNVAEMLDEVPYLHREVLLQHQEKSQRQLSKETGVCRDRLRYYKNEALKKLKEVSKDYGYE